MPDINPPTPENTANLTSDQPVAGTAATSTGLEPNVAAGLAAVFGLIGALVFFFIEKKSAFVRFWSAQLVVLWGTVFVFFIALTILSTLIGFIPGINVVWALLMLVLYPVLGLACLATWVFTLIQTFSGKEYKIPMVSDYAKQLEAKFPATA